MELVNRLIPSSLLGQFALAGGLVMTVATVIVGAWVSQRIEQGVVQNSAAAAALYFEGFVAPLSSELAVDGELSEPARVALHEIFFGPALGDRVVSYKIWKENGLVLDASNEDLRGQVFLPSDDLLAAWEGRVAASFEELNDDEDASEAELGIPLLEVYSPIRETWTGEIVAVVEFYERADTLADELRDAKRTSWLIVASVFAASGLLLFSIVRAASRLIFQQRQELETQLAESQRVSSQNLVLKDRVMAAAQRSTAQADRVMQRIGQDLHDGVAQHLSLASLRFEAAKPQDEGNASTVRQAMQTAMTELRAISRGLALPDIDQLDLGETLDRAIEDHQNAYNGDIANAVDVPMGLAAPYPIKLCAYRFVQEALANATRHAEATIIRVRASVSDGALEVRVEDDGKGFDVSSVSSVRLDGGQGLLGLRDRAETLNGSVELNSSASEGSVVKLILPITERVVE